MGRRVKYFIQDAGNNKEQAIAGADWLYTRRCFKPTKRSAFRHAQAGANATGCPMAVYSITYKIPEWRKKVTRTWRIMPAAQGVK